MKQLKGIALGTFPFANVFGEIDEQSASKILQRYIELGGEFIHVSLVYNNGKVEEFLGRELKKYPRESYKIMACCGWKYENSVAKFSGKKEDVNWCCDSALKRLGLDYIDVLMSHAPDTSTPYEETIDAMAALKKQGKCNELCVSNVSLEQLSRYNYKGDVNYIQNRFSLLNQSISDELFAYCKKNNIRITTFQSIERGLLTDQVLNGLDLPGSDLRTKKPEFVSDVKSVIRTWVAQNIKPMADKLGVSISTLVMAWTLQNQEIFALVCGISKEKYLSDYIRAVELMLSNEQLEEINAAYRKLAESIKRDYNKSVIEFMGI